ncbi:reverse transcriptase [Gossypium australe]|uniref:Reverse transcriptase n=1 Tax=Gossypium australe TaxID=47621 RepID=A0A5B6W8N4_9ROSI|nr:reverse transcriptase [Gossypium australe]
MFSYKNAKIFKEKLKRWHDKHIRPCVFEVGKLKSRWSRPFRINQVFPYGVYTSSCRDLSVMFISYWRLHHRYSILIR